MIIPFAKLQRNLLRCLRLFVLRRFRRRGRGGPIGAMQQLLQQPLGLAAVALRLVPIHRIAWRRSSPGYNGMGNFEKITGSEKNGYGWTWL